MLLTKLSLEYIFKKGFKQKDYPRSPYPWSTELGGDHLAKYTYQQLKILLVNWII